MATAAPTAATTEKAGIGARFVGILIDSIIVSIVSGILAGAMSAGDPFSATLQGLNLVLGALYFTYFWSAAGKGQTLGSKVMGIRVVKTDGSSLDYVGAFIRYIGYLISSYALLIGLIWAIFDSQKQGWHDKIAGTYVVKA